MKIDKKDRQILEALQTDARQSLAALGKRIGLSQPAMSERVRKLEDAGIVRRTEFEGYPRRVEYDLTVDGERLVPLIEALGDWWDGVSGVADPSQGRIAMI